MSYSKQWDSKVMVAILPLRLNKYRICHNCQYGWLPEEFNVCTGLCPNCVEKNIAGVKVPPKIVLSDDNVRKCSRCKYTKMPNNNFGILRDNCRSCVVEPVMMQRCMVCDVYRNDCWKNVCQGCRYNKFLCEKTGEFYANENIHWKQCWCLSYNQRMLRNKVTTNNNNVQE